LSPQQTVSIFEQFPSNVGYPSVAIATFCSVLTASIGFELPVEGLIKGEDKVVPVLFFNWILRHEGVLESGGIAPLIL
jgi:hypothetical protein